MNNISIDTLWLDDQKNGYKFHIYHYFIPKDHLYKEVESVTVLQGLCGFCRWRHFCKGISLAVEMLWIRCQPFDSKLWQWCADARSVTMACHITWQQEGEVKRRKLAARSSCVGGGSPKNTILIREDDRCTRSLEVNYYVCSLTSFTSGENTWLRRSHGADVIKV